MKSILIASALIAISVSTAHAQLPRLEKCAYVCHYWISAPFRYGTCNATSRQLGERCLCHHRAPVRGGVGFDYGTVYCAQQRLR